MLTISKPLNPGQAQTYHAKEFTSAEQNYWKQGDTIVGEWHGKLAEKYGLAGAVEAEKFARLAEGQHPGHGRAIGASPHRSAVHDGDGKTVAPVEHRAGWDATFSAPKSVSLTALVGGDDRVREAHREAVNAALAELERYTQARIGGNHAAETTGGSSRPSSSTTPPVLLTATPHPSSTPMRSSSISPNARTAQRAPSNRVGSSRPSSSLPRSIKPSSPIGCANSAMRSSQGAAARRRSRDTPRSISTLRARAVSRYSRL